MKKLMFLIIAVIAGIVLITSIGPMIALAISLAIIYFAMKQYLKSNETGSKILWAVIGIIAVISVISNIPALLGLVAVYVIYTLYKNWNKESKQSSPMEDPFTSFDKQWEELSKKL